MRFFYRHKRRGRYPWQTVYYIGEIQDVVEENIPEHLRIAPDLVTADRPIENVDEGIYDINVYGTDARLYIWDHLEEYEAIPVIEYMVPGEIPLDATHRELYAGNPPRTRIVSMDNEDRYQNLLDQGFTLMNYLREKLVK